MDEALFNEKYDYNNFQVVDVLNPTKKDYTLTITMEVGFNHALKRPETQTRTYVIPAGGHERLPGVAARKYLDEMTKYLAQVEDKFKLLVDFQTRADYYNRLTMPDGIEDRVRDYQPAGHLDVNSDQTKAAEVEQPFGGVAKEPARVGRPPKAN